MQSIHFQLKNLHIRWLPTTLYILFLILPLIPVIYISFHSMVAASDLASGELTFRNYQNIFKNEDLTAAIVSSVSYVLLNIIITIPIALPAAYAFSRFSFMGDKHLFLGFLALRMTPPVVMIFPVFQLFSSIDLINSPLAIALAHCLFNVPITIWVLESFMSAIPKEFDEAALIDGHSFSGFFIKKFIPLIAPGIGVAAFFCFMFSWVEVVFARILTVTSGKPISMAITSLFGFKTDIGLVMAMTVLSILPGAIMIFFVRHHIARGFTIQQVK